MRRWIGTGLVLFALVGSALAVMLRSSLRPDGAAAEQDQKTTPAVVLAEAKQQAIWEAEHVTFELETRFAKPFVAALAAGEMDDAAHFCHPEIEARVPVEPDRESRVVGTVVEQRARIAETREAGRPVFLEALRGPFTQMERVAHARLRVLKLRKRDADSGRWQARVLLAASGADRQGGPVGIESLHRVEFEIDEPRTLGEHVVVGWEVLSETTRRSPQVLMEEVTADVGLDQLRLPDNWQMPPEKANTYHFQMAVEDYDRDGFPDVAIATGGLEPILLRSRAGRAFEDVTRDMQLRPWFASSTLAAWIDYDNDAYPDLLLGTRLYRNIEGRRFVDVTHASGLTFDYDPMGCLVLDYDCDGWLDLYVLYQHGQTEHKMPWVGDNRAGAFNQLFRNTGKGVFRDVTSQARASGGKRFTFAATCLYLGEDRYPDLYIVNDFGHNVMLENTGDGVFRDVTDASGVPDFATSMGVTSGDLDNDGSPEIYVANMYSKMGRRIIDYVGPSDYPPGVYEQIQGSCAGNRLYTRRPGQRRFEEISEPAGVNGVGWAFAPTVGDLNNDGWLDLYATTGYLSFDRGKPDG